MDTYYVYRPLLDLTGFTEGTDKGDGYNETLGYGIMLDGRVSRGKGTDVALTAMTLDQVDALQTRMLKDPDNRWNSSAVGRYQIVRKTLRAIRDALDLTGSELFDTEMQDRMACYLLGLRGIDKYLSGRLREDTLLLNLAKEWASLPTPAGTGYYSGQHAAVSPERVRQVLAEVRRRHEAGQPLKEVVPETVEQEVRQKTNWLTWLTGLLGLTGSGVAKFLVDADWQTVGLIAGSAAVGAGVILVGGVWIVRRVKAIRAEIRRA